MSKLTWGGDIDVDVDAVSCMYSAEFTKPLDSLTSVVDMDASSNEAMEAHNRRADSLDSSIITRSILPERSSHLQTTF